MNKPIKVTKCPVEVEAMKLSCGESTTRAMDWIRSCGEPANIRVNRDLDAPGSGLELEVETFNGLVRAIHGDWVVRDTGGKFYPCNDEIFKKTYTGWEGDE